MEVQLIDVQEPPDLLDDDAGIVDVEGDADTIQLRSCGARNAGGHSTILADRGALSVIMANKRIQSW